MVMQRSLHHALDRDAILRALSVFQGVTTADGNVAGTTLICDSLIGSNDFITSKAILLQSGDAIYEDGGATGFNPVTGQITVDPAFNAQVKEGVAFYILSTASAAAIVAATSMGTPASGSVVANWNSGVASSGLAGADVITLGAADTKHRIHGLQVAIDGFTPGAVITIRLRMMVNNIERTVYVEYYEVGVDEDAPWIVDSPTPIHEACRCEVYSDNVADDGVTLDYDNLLE